MKERTEMCMKWLIGKGEIDFWRDRWWGEEILGDLIHDGSISNCGVTIREALQENSWQAQCGNGLSINEELGIRRWTNFLM